MCSWHYVVKVWCGLVAVVREFSGLGECGSCFTARPVTRMGSLAIAAFSMSGLEVSAMLHWALTQVAIIMVYFVSLFLNRIQIVTALPLYVIWNRYLFHMSPFHPANVLFCNIINISAACHWSDLHFLCAWLLWVEWRGSVFVFNVAKCFPDQIQMWSGWPHCVFWQHS